MNNYKVIFWRITHWEFWPFNLIYFPLIPIWAAFAIRSRTPFYFNASNPRIPYGGMAMEPKSKIYDLIPSNFYPTTIIIQPENSLEEIIEILKEKSLYFPLILKPNIGMKGLAVVEAKNERELAIYKSRIKTDFIIQEKIDFPTELGLFYVRLKPDRSGRLTGIVKKEFLSVKGDGKSTLKSLVLANPRSRFEQKRISVTFQSQWNRPLPAGQILVLVPFGSHTRGATFRDASHQINPQLESRLESICSAIPEFYYGRLDLMCNSLEDFAKGGPFKIIEINGAGSEPTHIYDPQHSIFFAWKEIVLHWYWLWRISKLQHQAGIPYLTWKEGWEMLKANKALEARLRQF